MRYWPLTVVILFLWTCKRPVSQQFNSVKVIVGADDRQKVDPRILGGQFKDANTLIPVWISYSGDLDALTNSGFQPRVVTDSLAGGFLKVASIQQIVRFSGLKYIEWSDQIRFEEKK